MVDGRFGTGADDLETVSAAFDGETEMPAHLTPAQQDFLVEAARLRRLARIAEVEDMPDLRERAGGPPGRSPPVRMADARRGGRGLRSGPASRRPFSSTGTSNRHR
ncbi:MAG: hypothetical protein R2695_12455 [Acidimicrobiales bacterium]